MYRTNNTWSIFSTILKLSFFVFIASSSNFIAKSQSRYELNCSQKLIDESLKIAKMELGNIEKTNKNDGGINKYNEAIGLPAGSAYCAAGQYYCFIKACERLSIELKNIPIKKTGSALAMFWDARNKGIKTKYKGTKNDFIVWKFGNSGRGHIERIIASSRAGSVFTIGFNVEKAGKQGVFIMKRNIYHPLGRLTILGIIGLKGKKI